MGLAWRTKVGRKCSSGWDAGDAVVANWQRDSYLAITTSTPLTKKTLAATPFSVFPSYVLVLRAGMAAAGAGGVGNAGFGSDGSGAGGRGYGAGRGGGRTGGGAGARGGRQA